MAAARQANFRNLSIIATLVANSEWGALARLGLARAYAMQGRHGESPV